MQKENDMTSVPDINREIGSRNDSGFIDDLTSFASDHQISRWRGTFGEFLDEILPADPYRLTRTSHQYIYDMLCWYRDQRNNDHPESTESEGSFYRRSVRH